MEQLATKLADLLGDGVRRLAQVYPDMVRAWRLRALVVIGLGLMAMTCATCLGWLVAANEVDGPDRGFFMFLCFVLGVVGLVCVALNIKTAVYPEAALVESLIGKVNPRQ